MTTATIAETPPKVWTAEDLLALPDDGVRRWIINGQLREQPSEFPEIKMTVRNRHHCQVMVCIGAAVLTWVRTRPKPRGCAYCGEVGVRLPGHTATVGIDVVYVSADVVAVQNDDDTTLIDGVPTLAVEILSPSTIQELIEEKIDTYLEAGVPLVWTVNPYRRTVTVFRPGNDPVMFSATQQIAEHPAMPGFAPSVAELFE